jgi:tetratricopeptide (TPR) repeat protein
MSENYKTIEHQLRKYSFEFLKVNEEPLNMLLELHEIYPQIIENAQKANLLAAAIIYVFLKNNNMNGRGGITAKDVGKYFEVKSTAISSKASDVEFWLYDNHEYVLENDNANEFIDKDRFEVNELYWEFLESPEADDVKKSIKALKSMIKKDADYFDPYITLHEYYLMDGDFKNAIKIMEKGFKRAIDLIDNNGKFPAELPWGFMENRHIIRMIFNFAMFIWANDDKDIALNIFMELLKSNHNDNVGARYSIVAILEGFDSQEEYEEQFESENGMGLEYEALEEWFEKSAIKYKDVIGWWLDLDEDF